MSWISQEQVDALFSATKEEEKKRKQKKRKCIFKPGLNSSLSALHNSEGFAINDYDDELGDHWVFSPIKNHFNGLFVCREEELEFT